MKRLIDFNPPKADKIIKTNVRVLSVHKSSQSVVKSCDTNSNNNVPCQKKRVHRSTSTAENDNPFNFVVGSAVRHIDKYGVIKWTGNLPGDKKVYAKVEMENGGGTYAVWTFLGSLKPDQRIKKDPSPVARSCSQISMKSDEANDDHDVATSKLPTNPCDYDVTEESSQASNQSDNADSTHGEEIISDDAVDLVDIATLNIEDETINPHKLTVGSVIHYDDPPLLGVIKWIGKLPNQQGIWTGLEMDDICDDDPDDGEWEGIEYYKCKQSRGIFVQLSELKLGMRPMAVVQLQNPHNFEVGTTVRHGIPANYGVIKWMGILPGQQMAYAGLEMDECIEGETDDGVWKGIRYYNCESKRGRFIPMIDLKPYNGGNRRGSADNILLKCNNETDASKHHPRRSSLESPQLADNFDVYRKSQRILGNGSMIQFGKPVQYGVIKRIEISADTSVEIAEVEMNNDQLKKIPLTELEPDNRFIIDFNNTKGNINPLEKEHYKHDEAQPHILPDTKFKKHKHGGTKGIQGYQNSCYLDATLYGMFAFSDAFDVLLTEEGKINDEELHVQKILKNDIVYPLRKKGIVVQESVEGFREHLAKLQDMKGLTSEEKDPEEFLNLLFKHVLYIEPFITIRRPSGIDKEFFVQLFVEPGKNEPPVNTERLLNKMFQEQEITFTECPTKLLLQMPRYGKSFKSFQRIIPSLKLDVTCSPKLHQKPHDHKNELKSFDTRTLQLLSVLCIETSHYVCFTRITGSGKDEWVFFDSMAERQNNGYNLPKVTHCTEQLHKYVYSKKEIGKIPSKNLPELARRFVEDAYLCVYTAKDTGQLSASMKR